MPTLPSLHARLRAGILLLLVLIAGLGTAPARAGIADAPGSDLQVSLITYGPGAIYWERFGHDAIELRDRGSGEAVTFNYGVFDFEETGFLLHFARGIMHYRMDAEPADADIRWYADAGRSVRRQQLALTPEQAARLRDFLLWNLRPEHARYDYDYYTDNCTTRVRDALDRALGGVLHARLSGRPGGLTYRQQTDRLMAAQPWLMLALDLGLSGYADRPLTAWQESFLPSVLAREIGAVQVDEGHGDRHLLVERDTLVAPARLPAPPDAPPDLRLPLLLAGAVVALVLLWSGRAEPSRVQRIAFGTLGTAFAAFAGLAGLLMLALWTLTAHRAGWANANLLLFDPLAWLLLPALWRARVSRFAHALAWLLTVLAALALVANVGGLLAQRNLPWILFALPVWVALLRGLRRRTEGA